MSENVYSWSTTAASNASADSAINLAEGQLPGTVNNSARSLMAALAKFLADTNGTLSTAGSANAYTVASPNTTYAALATGLIIGVKASFTNTGAATLNLSSLGPKAIKYTSVNGESALLLNQIVSGGHYILRYDAAANSAAGAWLLLNPSQNVIADAMVINGDTFIRHPLTPSADNDAGTLIGIGKGALASIAPIHSTQYVTAMGINAGNALTTCDHITAIGAYALSSITDATCANNTAVGVDALRFLTSGIHNVGVGEHALSSLTTGTSNTAMGCEALFKPTGGSYNVAVGQNAMLGVVSTAVGDNNTAVGALALGSVTTTAATDNTAVGFGAAGTVTTGAANTTLGYLAGFALTTGSRNTIIGAGAGQTTLTTGADNILIGTLNNLVDTPASSTSGYLNIGNAIKATGLGVSPVVTVSGTLTTTGVVTNSSTTTLSGALTYGGVTLSNAVTGTGNMVLSASPTFTGTVLAAAATFSGVVTHSSTTTLSGALTYGGVTLSNAVTGTGNMVLSAGPTLTGTTTLTGPADISGASAGQIIFPATQNASANVNTLDDYEEGTFTPAVAFGGASVGVTYASRSGTYVKIGQVVQIQIAITLSSKGSSTGTAAITGLPFTSNAVLSPLSPYVHSVNTTAPYFVGVNTSATTCFVQVLVAGSVANASDATFNNDTIILASGTYRTTA